MKMYDYLTFEKKYLERFNNDKGLCREVWTFANEQYGKGFDEGYLSDD